MCILGIRPIRNFIMIEDYKRYQKAKEILDLINESESGYWFSSEPREFSNSTKEYAREMIKYTEDSLKDNIRERKIISAFINLQSTCSNEEIIRKAIKYIDDDRVYSDITARALSEVSRYISDFYVSFTTALYTIHRELTFSIINLENELVLYKNLTEMDFSLDIGFKYDRSQNL